MDIKLNEQWVECSEFPGGEIRVKLQSPVESKNVVFCLIKKSDDFFKLALIIDAIRRERNDCIIEVVLPYLPYARQDDVFSHGESLSCDVFCKLINSLPLDKLYIFDAHSNVSIACLQKCKHITIEEIFGMMRFFPFRNNIISPITLICPDAGSEKKIRKVVLELSRNSIKSEIIYCRKERDLKGNIVEMNIYGDVKGKDCFIVDDICDGGATFICLSKKLKEMDATKVILYVTHGIFSKGLDELKKNIDIIYCLYSFDSNLNSKNTDGFLFNLTGMEYMHEFFYKSTTLY